MQPLLQPQAVAAVAARVADREADEVELEVLGLEVGANALSQHAGSGWRTGLDRQLVSVVVVHRQRYRRRVVVFQTDEVLHAEDAIRAVVNNGRVVR